MAAYGEASSRSAFTFMPPVTRQMVSRPDRSVTSRKCVLLPPPAPPPAWSGRWLCSRPEPPWVPGRNSVTGVSISALQGRQRTNCAPTPPRQRASHPLRRSLADTTAEGASAHARRAGRRDAGGRGGRERRHTGRRSTGGALTMLAACNCTRYDTAWGWVA
eukprot:scaffold463_cov351-Prasinococcus_capsulatus_cf.AAC.10